jgi:monoamine oxidase
MSAMGIAVSTAARGASGGVGGAPAVHSASGAGALAQVVPPAPGEWPAGVGANSSVVILGAGIAGMTAAWELGKLGYRCILLEAQRRAGGRCRTIRSGDTVQELGSTQFCEFDDDPRLYFNPGPARIPHHHQYLLGYCRQFGVALEPFNNDNRAALLQSATAFAGKPQAVRRVLADTRGQVAALLATAVDQGALDQALGGADRQRLRAMLGEFGDLSPAGRYTGSRRAGVAGRDSELLPPLSLEALLDSGFWQYQLDYSQSLEQQPTLLQPVGGMDRIARAFGARVGGKIRYGALVSLIRTVNTGVNVRYLQGGEERKITADYCICTIPATVLKGIDNNFSAAHQAAIAGFQYTQACKIAFQATRFWERKQHIYGGISWTDQDITQLWYPSSDLGSAQGVILGAYTFGDTAGRRFARRSPQQRLDACKQQARKLHPQFGNKARHGISVSWPQMPHQLGAWGASDPGVLRNHDRRVYFAGEHVSDLQGWQEGAIRSAYSAIDAIVRRDT